MKLSLIFGFLAFLILIGSVNATSVTRSFSDTIVGHNANVTTNLVVSLTNGETYYLIDETYPSGWAIVDQGTGDTTQPNHIKWVIITGAVNTTLSYVIQSPVVDGYYNWSGEWIAEGMSFSEIISGEFQVFVDPVIPNITIISPQNISYNTSDMPIALDVSADTANDSWWYSLNGGANTTFVPNTTITFQMGNNNLIVYANDTDGNIGSANVSFFVNSSILHCDSCSNCTNILSSVASAGDTVLLDNNISVAGTCITVNIPNVTFDCQWHSITGSKGFSTGLILSRPNNTIKNCFISAFSTIISLSSSSNYTELSNLILFNPAVGDVIKISNGNYNYLHDLQILNNGTNGIEFVGGANTYYFGNILKNINMTGFHSGVGIIANSATLTLINTTIDNVSISNFTNAMLFRANVNNLSINNSLFENTDSAVGCISILNIGTRGWRNFTITNSIIRGCSIGINFGAGAENMSEVSIYNNFFNNTINYVNSSSGDSVSWNTTISSGTNIAGRNQIGGNYWAYPNGTGYSETCDNLDNDSFCDAPFTLATNNIDFLPLTNNYSEENESEINLDWETPLNNSIININSIIWKVNLSEAPISCILNINGTNVSMSILGSECAFTSANLINQTTYCGIVFANDIDESNVTGIQCATTAFHTPLIDNLGQFGFLGAILMGTGILLFLIEGFFGSVQDLLRDPKKLVTMIIGAVILVAIISVFF